MKDIEKAPEPELIKAGSSRLGLGITLQPPKVDCRVVSEDRYQKLIKAEEQLQEKLQSIIQKIEEFDFIEVRDKCFSDDIVSEMKELIK